jgi:hypothetical protein
MKPKSSRDHISNGTIKRSTVAAASAKADPHTEGKEANALATPGVASDLSRGQT